MFIKKFKNKILAQKEFTRSLEIYESIRECKFVKTPNPIKVSGEKIFFELISNVVSLQSLTNKIFVSSCIKNYFCLTGKALAEFHKAINPDKNIEKDKINIHGDFWVENILINREAQEIYFVDFSLPKSLNFEPYDYCYADIGYFLTDVLYRYPLYVFYLRYRNLNRDIAESFLKGYSDQSGFEIDKIKLSNALIDSLNKRREIFRHMNVVSRFIWGIVIERDIKKELRKLGQDYRYSHAHKIRANEYDNVVYDKLSPENVIWEREKKVLNKILDGKRFTRYLDFACGTGRILSELNKCADYSAGVDVSEEMLKKARNKNLKTDLIAGDPTENPNLIEGKFNLITAFRFFLNAQNELRDKALQFIHSRLQDDGLFILNNHGNRYSLHLLVRVKEVFDRSFKNSELAHHEIVNTLKRNGFEIIEMYPVNYFLKVMLKILPEKFTNFLNDRIVSSGIFKNNAIEVIYVCRKK